MPATGLEQVPALPSRGDPVLPITLGLREYEIAFHSQSRWTVSRVGPARSRAGLLVVHNGIYRAADRKGHAVAAHRDWRFVVEQL